MTSGRSTRPTRRAVPAARVVAAVLGAAGCALLEVGKRPRSTELATLPGMKRPGAGASVDRKGGFIAEYWPVTVYATGRGGPAAPGGAARRRIQADAGERKRDARTEGAYRDAAERERSAERATPTS
jgi:hypothetical protein